MASTAATRSGTLTVGGYSTRAVSVAKFTDAFTPSMRLSLRSIRIAHEAQVIPPMSSSTWARPAAAPACDTSVTPASLARHAAADALC